MEVSIGENIASLLLVVIQYLFKNSTTSYEENKTQPKPMEYCEA